jgi:hypothetical protein
MNIRRTIALLGLLCVSAVTYGKGPVYQVVVTDPYIELHTGAGNGYPIVHVVDRGTTISVHKRHTDWFKVSTDRDVEGWVHAEQLSRTMEPDGQPTKIKNPNEDDFLARQKEFGIQIGDFDGANVISVYGSYLFTRNLSAELSGSHLSGDFSDGWMVNINLLHQPFPSWVVSPFFTLGTGVIHIQPNTTLVQTEDRTDQEAHVGFGLRTHLGRSFILRAEYKSYVVFTSRNENEEVDEWKAGFAFFF